MTLERGWWYIPGGRRPNGRWEDEDTDERPSLNMSSSFLAVKLFANDIVSSSIAWKYKYLLSQKVITKTIVNYFWVLRIMLGTLSVFSQC